MWDALACELKSLHVLLNTTSFMLGSVLQSQWLTVWFCLVWQALLMKHCTLAIMLLTQAALHTSPPPENPAASDKGTQAAFDMTVELFCASVDILLQCGNAPAALAQVMVPVMERYESQRGEITLLIFKQVHFLQIGGFGLKSMLELMRNENFNFWY